LIKNDDDRLEYLTSLFILNLIKHGFTDKLKYMELAERMVNLIEYEVKFHGDKEMERLLMSSWGPNIN
jgi:hypothetical protein